MNELGIHALMVARCLKVLPILATTQEWAWRFKSSTLSPALAFIADIFLGLPYGSLLNLISQMQLAIAN